ncbi:MAG: hypothetical protein ACH349_07515 [Candidatus Rhabdochlamydia sp.]
MEAIKNIIAGFSKKKATEKRIEFEFQALGLELQDYFKIKNPFFIFYQKWGTEDNVRRALKICKDKKVTSFAYFLGILKKL